MGRTRSPRRGSERSGRGGDGPESTREELPGGAAADATTSAAGRGGLMAPRTPEAPADTTRGRRGCRPLTGDGPTSGTEDR